MARDNSLHFSWWYWLEALTWIRFFSLCKKRNINVLPAIGSVRHNGGALLGPAFQPAVLSPLTARGGAVSLWHHRIQFLHRWHSFPGPTFISWQWCVPPPDIECEPGQRPAVSWWLLQPWGGGRGSGEWEWTRWLRWDGGGGDGQHHRGALQLLCAEELHALSVPFPEAQLGAWQERSQRRWNEPPEVRRQAVCLPPLSCSWEVSGLGSSLVADLRSTVVQKNEIALGVRKATVSNSSPRPFFVDILGQITWPLWALIFSSVKYLPFRVFVISITTKMCLWHSRYLRSGNVFRLALLMKFIDYKMLERIICQF